MVLKSRGRGYYCWLAKQNNILETWATLLSKSIKDIKLLVNNYDSNEKFEEYRNIIINSKWINYKNDELIAELKIRGIPHSSCTKDIMIFTLIQNPNIEKISLDSDQTNILETFLSFSELKCVIHAGPGAGKTTLLTYLIYHGIKENKIKRILFLVYTKSAKKIIETKLKKLLIKIENRKNILKINNNVQMFVLTMDEYSCKRLNFNSNNDFNINENNTYRDTFLSGVTKGIQT